MTTNILHFSDTIQSQPSNISNHDTTVTRLALWYEILQKKLGFSTQKGVEFYASEFGNSFQTAAQALKYLQTRGISSTQVILVNNASRAKHLNSGSAKGSDCIWMQIQIGGIIHHIVGVDDEVFSIFEHFRVPGIPAQKILGVNLKTPEGIHFDITDVSLGTQFRSKEHFPLIQLILLKVLEQKGDVQLQDVHPYFSLSEVSIIDTQAIVDEVSRVLGNTVGGDIQGNISEFARQIGDLIIGSPYYKKTYISGFEGVENIQLLGELHILREKFGIFTQELPEGFSVGNDVLSLYHTTRQILLPNQLLLIDRDKFGNTIFAPALGVSDIQSFAQINGFSIHKKGAEKALSRINISGSFGKSDAYLTSTISDLTGQNCIWQSSSAGPNGEKFFNINTSIGPEGQIFEVLQGLTIGSVLTLDSIL